MAEKKKPKIKKCLKCSKRKDIEHFGEHQSNADGYQIWCYGCMAKYQRKKYVAYAEVKKEQVKTRREKLGRLLEKTKARNPCYSCGEDEPMVLSLLGLQPATPKVTKSSGAAKIRQALNDSAIVCLNCRVKLEAGLIAAPSGPLRWNPAELEIDVKKPRIVKEEPNPALPSGVLPQ